MEARTLAKVNQIKSDQIAKDIAEFQARGGKIQVIEHKNEAERIESVKKATASGYSNAKQRGAKSTKAAVKAVLDDTEDELEDDLPAPSTETPTEQLETPIE